MLVHHCLGREKLLTNKKLLWILDKSRSLFLWRRVVFFLNKLKLCAAMALLNEVGCELNYSCVKVLSTSFMS